MNIQRFLRQIHHTQEEEILCSTCLEQVDQYIDLELGGRPASALMPHLKHHLEMCPVCHEEYTILRDLAQLEQQGRPPEIGDLQSYLGGEPRSSFGVILAALQPK